MNIKDSTIEYVKFRLRTVKEDLEDIYETLESEVIWSEVNRINEILSLLEKPPKKERKLLYCQDCAYFKDALAHNPEKPLWYTCQHSNYLRGIHIGKSRLITKSTIICNDFLPAGESVEFHEGIKDLLNNITIKESEEE